MSWKAEVRVYNDPKYYSNALRFATEGEAKAYARDLHSRWMQAEDERVVTSDEPVNYRFTEKGLEALEQ